MFGEPENQSLLTPEKGIERDSGTCGGKSLLTAHALNTKEQNHRKKWPFKDGPPSGTY